MPDPSPPKLPARVVETCLYTHNLANAIAFYERLFQFPLLFTDHIRFCAFDAGASHILLLFTEDGSHGPTPTPGGLIPPHDSTGRQHIGFAIPTDSLPAWREKLALENIPIESEVTWPRGGTSLYFRDPDQHLLELLTPGVWTTY